MALCAAWNSIGFAQPARGVHTIGHTASFGTTAVGRLFGAGLLVFPEHGKETPYLLTSPLGLLLVGAATVGAFTKDPSSWPSGLWRWPAFAANTVGVIGFLLTLGTFIRGTSNPSTPPWPSP